MPVTTPPRVSHRARHRDPGGVAARPHLTAVPALGGTLVTAVRSADADALARDAQRELTALGHALHDGPIQSIIAASLALQLAERASGDGPEAGPQAPAYGLAEAREALDDALRALRTTMGDLNPPGVQGGLGQMLAALRERTGGLVVDDRATGAVTAEITGAVFRLLAALGATSAGAPAVAVVTRDRPGVVVCEVRLRGRDASERTRREEVGRALRRLDALGGRAAVARAGGGADLLLALPSDTHSAPAPVLSLRGLALDGDRATARDDDYRGERRTPGAPALAPTGTEDRR